MHLPPKCSLNPYTGCPHGCLYCYASSYIPHFSRCRPKADLLRRLAREAAKVKPGTLVALSNSSDPYPPMEEELRLSRGCLEILKSGASVPGGDQVRILAARDAASSGRYELLRGHDRDHVGGLNLPQSGAGSAIAGQRLKAMKKLADTGVAVSARIDPIIPGINDAEIDDLVQRCHRGSAYNLIHL